MSFLLLLLLSACKGCDEIDHGKAGELLVVPDPISFSVTPIGTSNEVSVEVKNIGEERLRIFEMRVEVEGGGQADAMRLEDVPSGEFSIEPGGEKLIKVVYTPSVTTSETRYSLVVRSSDPKYSFDSPLKVPIATIANLARIDITPNPVRFSRSQAGKQYVKQVEIRNYGSADLILTEFPSRVSGADYKIGGSNFGDLNTTKRKFPITLKPYDSQKVGQFPQDYELILDIIYSPLGDGDDTGQFSIKYRGSTSNELMSENLDVVATASAKCIYVHPVVVQMGQVPIGKKGTNGFWITNCGTEDLSISAIDLSQNSSFGDFSLSLGYPTDAAGALTAPIVLPPGEDSSPIVVDYAALKEGTDSAEITIKSNDEYQPELKVQVIARGSDGQCPIVSVGGYVEGVSVTPKPVLSMAPLKYLILDGSASNDPDGHIVHWNWSIVKKPLGASSVLEPLPGDPTNSDQSKRRYRPLVAGDYEFKLDVVDQEGFAGCAAQTVVVHVIPAKKIHIELTWTNPEDPDETDNRGSDVDLHFVKMGPGEWFRKPYDIYFRNMNNVDWHPERPTLDIDDQDGGGPENIQLDNPANCQWYAVGVGYFKQVYGTAYITVRIYVDQKLTFEVTNLSMTKTGNFYDIARIHWDGTSFTVQGVDNFYPVHPIGQKPKVTADMKEKSGGSYLYCTAEHLY